MLILSPSFLFFSFLFFPLLLGILFVHFRRRSFFFFFFFSKKNCDSVVLSYIVQDIYNSTVAY